MKKVIKKKLKSVSPVASEVITASSPELLERQYNVGIGKLEIDLGRGDLNTLRDKINELIDKLNASTL